MKRIINVFVSLVITAVFFSSCVTKGRYLGMQTRATEERNTNILLSSRIARLEDTLNNLHGRLGALNNANQNAVNELSRTNSELNLTKEQIEAQRERLQQLQAFIDQQKKASEDLKKNISEALIGFKPDELVVTMKNGKVYVSMQEALLFPSGSAKVNPRGKEALSLVASVLNKNPDVSIDIEGHTDDVPIHTTAYPDNWALSTARATSIAHVLIDEYGVSPTKLVASGRSKYDPVASNSTPEGRQQNRRTEIILEPRYNELMMLMNGQTVKK
jgi:chemotaxis protein MotB